MINGIEIQNHDKKVKKKNNYEVKGLNSLFFTFYFIIKFFSLNLIYLFSQAFFFFFLLAVMASQRKTVSLSVFGTGRV